MLWKHVRRNSLHHHFLHNPVVTLTHNANNEGTLPYHKFLPDSFTSATSWPSSSSDLVKIWFTANPSNPPKHSIWFVALIHLVDSLNQRDSDGTWATKRTFEALGAHGRNKFAKNENEKWDFEIDKDPMKTLRCDSHSRSLAEPFAQNLQQPLWIIKNSKRGTKLIAVLIKKWKGILSITC